MDYIKAVRAKVGTDPIFLNVANAIILNDQDEVLFQKRGKETVESWSFPGGAMELGESAERALLREVKEETGLDVKIEYFLGAYTDNPLVTFPNGDKAHVIQFTFVCRSKDGELKADGTETLELKYFSVANKPTLFRKHMEDAYHDFLDGKKGVIQ